MDAAHIHLILNHVPLLGTVFGFLLLAYAQFVHSAGDGRNSLVRASLGVFVISGLAAGAVYLTGEEAEDIVENVAGVSEALIEPHEEVALYALIAALVLGGVALLGLVLFRKRALPTWLSTLVLILALSTTGIMGYTAYLGGQINHPEIRTDAGISQPAGDTYEEYNYEEDD